MQQQSIIPPSRKQEILKQNLYTAFRTRHTWITSITISLTIAIVAVFLLLSLIFSHILHAYFILSIFSFPFNDVLLFLSLLAFLFIIIFLIELFTAKKTAIRKYLKQVSSHFDAQMKSYYAPTRTPELSEDQGKHLLLLGLPGSGKTKSLEYFLYQATKSARRDYSRIPVLLQMKNYNGFFQQSQSAAEDTQQAKLLAYLLEDKAHSKATKDSELVGIHHLRPYLKQLVEQGSIVFLCDGMNEIEPDVLPPVHAELIRIMQQTPNRVIMTCRELEYQEQDLLKDFVRQGATRKTLLPLAEADVLPFVERYLQGQIALAKKSKEKTRSQEQVQQIVEKVRIINKPHRYTSPFMLIMLIEALNRLDIRQDQALSRGRLLQISIEQSITRITGEDTSEIRRFLSIIACTARRNGQRNAIQLGSRRRPISSAGFAEDIALWFKDNEVDDNYPPADIHKLLDSAQKAEVITISQYGVLSFKHELIAEYFAAQALLTTYHNNARDDAFWASLYESEVEAPGTWSEPIALWAGLEDRPLDIARFLIEWTEDYNRSPNIQQNIEMYHALALSLSCIGVNPPTTLPASIERYLGQYVRSTAEREALADIFKRCADEGGIEVYRALLAFVDTPGISDLFLELDQRHTTANDTDDAILTLLFDHLEVFALDSAYVDQTRELVSILGAMGKRARPRARAFSEQQKPTLLRIDAIAILGGIKNAEDVPLLINYLRDTNRDIVGATIASLKAFGPDLTLTALEEQQKTLLQGYAQVRLNILIVLQHFLDAEQSAPLAPSRYYKRIIATTIQFLSSFDAPETRQSARATLNTQMQANTQGERIVTELLLNTLVTPDMGQAEIISKLLQEHCIRILPYIIEYWEKQAPSDLVRTRLITILGNVQNKPILDFLLKQLDEPQGSVRDTLRSALVKHKPIQPLLERIFSPRTTTNASELSVNVLQEIGTDSIELMCKGLLQMSAHADAPESGIHSLVELLNYFREHTLIPHNANEGVICTLIALFNWCIDTVKYPDLATYNIQVMVNFQDSLVVPPLLNVLAHSESSFQNVYAQAIKGLSTLGDIAFTQLVEALNSSRETLTTQRVRQAVLGMNPFPYDKLLAIFKDQRKAVVAQVQSIFVAYQDKSQTASFLVDHLGDKHHDLTNNVAQTIKAMPPAITMPYVVKALNRAGWQKTLEELLLSCPENDTVITLLVDELSDGQRSQPASTVLLQFNSLLVLPRLLPGLERDDARSATKTLIVNMVAAYQTPNDLLPHIISLFKPAATRPVVRVALRELLTHELATISLPALIHALQEQPLIEDCSLALETLVNLRQKQQEVLQAVLQALRDPYKRLGAHSTLVRFGQVAAQSVYNLLWDTNSSITSEARAILADMGEIAFPFIHKLAHDPQRASDAKDIFMRMDGSAAARGLIPFIVSNDFQEMEMAFYLLSMRINEEYRSNVFSMTKAIAEQATVQQNSDERLRILTILLFFNSNSRIQQRKKVAELIIAAIQKAPEYHAEFMHALLILGKQAEEPLAQILDEPTLSTIVRLEAIGTLSTLSLHPKILSYIKGLTARTQNSGGKTRNLAELDSELDLGFRALGGLLSSGIYNTEELRVLLQNSKSEGDLTSFEFYDVLLSTRNMPTIKKLNQQVEQNENTIAQQQANIRGKENTIEQLTQHTQQLTQQVQQFTRQVQQLQTTINTRDQDMQQLQQSLQVAQQHAANLQNTINRLQSPGS